MSNQKRIWKNTNRHQCSVLSLLNALDAAECRFDQMKKKELFKFYMENVFQLCYIPFHEIVVTMLQAKFIIRTDDLSVINFNYERIYVNLGEANPAQLRMSTRIYERHMMLQGRLVDSQFRFPFENGHPMPAQNGQRQKRSRPKKNNSPRIKKEQTSQQQNGNSGQRPQKAKAIETFVDQRYGFELGKTFEPEIFRDVKNFCRECANAFLTPEDFAEHCLTEQHKFRVLYQKVNSSHPLSSKMPPKELSGAEHGITIESLDGTEGAAIFEVKILLTVQQQLQKARITRELCLKVQYTPTSSANCINLLETFLVAGTRDGVLLEGDLPLEIESGEVVERRMAFNVETVGTKEFIVVFKFSTEEGTEFYVMKRIHLRVDDESTTEDGLKVSYKKRVHGEKSVENGTQETENWSEVDFNIEEPLLAETVVPPPRPRQALKYPVTLGNFPLPKQYIKFFNYGFKSGPKTSISVLNSKLQILEYLSEGLNSENYSRYMALLLFLEEHQCLCDLRSYKMDDAQLDIINHGRTFRLNVPGLAENRPSVLKYDGIYITIGADVYKGFVQQVEETTIRLAMGSRFRKAYIAKMKVTVHFSFNRNSLRNQHRALELIKRNNALANICYPKKFGGFENDIKIPSWFNRLISMNPQQCQAVQNILCGTSKPAPYLIFGPPGTGKTVTIVESIKQIFHLKPESCVLATAPSNTAADLLAERILESVPKSKFIRLYGPSRDYRLVPEKLRGASNFYEEECIFPAKNTLMGYRVIVTTVIMVGRLVSAGFPTGHFDYIYVDECGHSLEAAALVPLAGLIHPAPNPTQVILAGDPKQLGPVIRSPVAKQLGLSDSLLHRLMETIELYQKKEGEYNSACLTKLLRNFRSHPHILKVPSDLFYGNELIPCGDMTITSSACNWEWLPTKGFPLIFHGMEGKDEREASSPSFFNIAEVAEVVSYVEKISTSKFCGQKLRPADVGIISPYRGQVNKIHRALQRKGLEGYSVGSVEEFQGQERRIIIISTVRSNPAQLLLDQKFRLGFVREPRRFNVAVTRAKALLIVVGNPFILQTDPNWRQLLEFIMKGGGYTGIPFYPMEPDAIIGEDPNEHRIPVQEKLIEQLQLTKKAIEHFQAHGDMPTDEVDATAQAEQTERLIKQLQEMNILKVEVSELEELVSPPFQHDE